MLQRAAARLELGEHGDLRAQQLGIERLEHVVDRADPVAADDVADLVARGGQEHDRDVAGPRAALDQLSRLEPVEPGHPHVEQDQREVVLEQQPQRLAPEVARVQRVAERRQHGFERREVLRAVVDEQDRQRVDRGQLVGRSLPARRSDASARML